MKIAIIGAGISGLTAGIEFKKFGHEVIIFEKSRGYGGRMATRYAEDDKNLKLDHGVPFITSTTDEFSKRLETLAENNILEEWGNEQLIRDQNDFKSVENRIYRSFIAPMGMNSIGKFMASDLDIRTGERVSKLSIDERQNHWVIECESGLTESADALIISTPAPQTSELLSTAGEGVGVQHMINELKKVSYDPQFALLLTYSQVQEPDRGVINLDDKIINFISYESKKRDLRKTGIVVHSSADFAIKYIDEDRDKVADIMLEKLISILGNWAENPDWKQLHLWRYSRTREYLPYDFLEISGNDIPLALVGSYMKGNTVESAYLSGLNLARKWIDQFSEKE